LNVSARRQRTPQHTTWCAVDIWDGPDNSPIIYHGHTLVKALALSDACKAINGTAFKTSPYPVILSIENHCTEQQQVRMAEIFIECFGERLYSHGQQQSLSPASLMVSEPCIYDFTTIPNARSIAY
jgi:hypothetical protein